MVPGLSALIEAAERSDAEPLDSVDSIPSSALCLCPCPALPSADAVEENDYPRLQPAAGPTGKKRKARDALSPLDESKLSAAGRGKRSAAAARSEPSAAEYDKNGKKHATGKNQSRIGMKYDTAKKRLQLLQDTLFGEKKPDKGCAAQAIAAALKLSFTADESEERAASNSEEDEGLSKEAAEVENLKKELDDLKRERELAQQDNGIVAELRKEIAAANAMCAEIRTQLDKALAAKEESYARGLERGMTRAFNTSG